MNRKQTVLAVLVTALFVLAICATWTVAQTEGVIYACVNPAGALRVVGDNVSCLPKETLLEWNIQGEKGDKGDQGDVGPAGVLGFYVVEETKTCVPGQLCVLIAFCNQGDYVTGGGISKSIWNAFGDPGIGVISMYPHYESDPDQWGYLVAVNNQHSSDVEFQAYAVCAQMP